MVHLRFHANALVIAALLWEYAADYESGYKLGEIAFALSINLRRNLKNHLFILFSYLSHWRAHYQESLDYYDLSYSTGLETGDLMHRLMPLPIKCTY